MVHALKEAQRVIKQEGLIIDLRPIAQDTILELVTDDQVIPVGLIDGSKGKVHDAATNRALTAVGKNLREIGRDCLIVSVNYESLHELIEHLSESSRRALISDQAIQLIHKLTKRKHVHLRFYEDVRLTCYRLK